jgi:hypothetical protein
MRSNLSGSRAGFKHDCRGERINYEIPWISTVANEGKRIKHENPKRTKVRIYQDE